jgi:hypothetical protein
MREAASVSTAKSDVSLPYVLSSEIQWPDESSASDCTDGPDIAADLP